MKPWRRLFAGSFNAGILFFCALIVLTSCQQDVYAPKYQFRGAWVATVKNIDWPSKPGLHSEQMKSEFSSIVSHHHHAGINALVVQVRPVTDAFFDSDYEPWSQFISGNQGEAPVVPFDLLQFMIQETHSKGMEFHAWLNPYRAVVDFGKAKTSLSHPSRIRPSWFLNYGDNTYFDPGIPEVRDYLVEVVKEMVQKYDVDAIHFDDYFYPYKISGIDFPDSTSFKKYGNDFPNIDDWRRSNVDKLVESLSIAIKGVKPHVKFGISPFGVWRNKSVDSRGSETKAGQTNYDDLYADVIGWTQNGWVDYMAPQLYWHIGFEAADYSVLVEWWNNNDNGRHIYIGQASYRIDNHSAPEWTNPSEMPSHLRMNESFENIQGDIYFNTNSLVNNPLGFTDSLRFYHYNHMALTPRMPWIDHEAPKAITEIRMDYKNGKSRLSWKKPDEEVYRYVVYRFKGSEIGDLNNAKNILTILPHYQTEYTEHVQLKGKYTYVVTALDRLNNESAISPSVIVKFK